MACLVTVGSTKFEALTQHLDDNASEFLDILEKELGTVKKLYFQYGKTTQNFDTLRKLCKERKVQFEAFEFTPKFKEILAASSLVISHAGAGSITETLHLKKPLLVVVNETLMDNHQIELAEAMCSEGYLFWTNVKGVLEKLSTSNFRKLKPYPKPDAKAFAVLLDKELGFVDET